MRIIKYVNNITTIKSKYHYEKNCKKDKKI